MSLFLPTSWAITVDSLVSTLLCYSVLYAQDKKKNTW